MIPTTKTWVTIQIRCPGYSDSLHYDIPEWFDVTHSESDFQCDGGEWIDDQSLGWFNDNPAEALAIYRNPVNNDDGKIPEVRAVRRTLTEEVLDL